MMNGVKPYGWLDFQRCLSDSKMMVAFDGEVKDGSLAMGINIGNTTAYRLDVLEMLRLYQAMSVNITGRQPEYPPEVQKAIRRIEEERIRESVAAASERRRLEKFPVKA